METAGFFDGGWPFLLHKKPQGGLGNNKVWLPMYTRQLIFSDLQDVEIELELRKY